MTRVRAVGVCCALALWSCGAPDAVHRPDVLIVCIDALRADHLGVYGAGGGMSPNLDRLGAEAVVFERALSVASWTRPAVASLLTGLFPQQHRVLHAGVSGADMMAPEVETLAETLAARGYRTGAFVQNEHLQQATSGLLQGYDTTVEDAGQAPLLTHRFLTWLERLAPDAPFFAYLHVFDPHWPYTPELAAPGGAGDATDALRAAQWGLHTGHWWLLRERVNRSGLVLDAGQLDTLRALYDSEIFMTDAVIGRVIQLLRAGGRLDRTLLVVTADHGEGFGEHGRLDHGYGPYHELVRVPLIIHFPGRRHAGTRVASMVQTADIVPTVLDVLGLPQPSVLATHSLLPLSADPARPVAWPAVSHETIGLRRFTALRTATYTYIRGDPIPGRLRAAPAVPGDLVPGVRVQLEGILVNGEVIGAQLTRVGAEDQDDEVAGPVEFVDSDAGALGLVGYRVVIDADTRLKDAQGTFQLADLHRLQWVRAQGAAAPGLLRATKIERILDPALREIELEGVVREVAPTGDGEVVVALCGRRVRIDRDAAWKRFAARREVQDAAPPPPAAAVIEELYDVRVDPDERRSVAAEQPGVLAALRAEVAAWQQRLERDAVREVPRAELDPATRDRLRLLGYLQ